MSLRGKTVVITGASSGIGRATALEMARRGANLFLGARRPEQLEETAAACRAMGVSAAAVVTDVTKRDDCRRLIASAGRVDVLVNNAGYAVYDSVVDANIEDFRELMDTNYFGTVHCTQAVLPQMLERGEGSIVNVSSITGIMGFARMSAYCATKAAIIVFTEALRSEVMPRGVKVALVCPSTTKTEFFVKAEFDKMPAAARLIPGMKPERVARAICSAAEDGKYRRILPWTNAVYMRMKEIFPRFSHLLMRRVSSLKERR
jgi:short-subunit dehydrogenase